MYLLQSKYSISLAVTPNEILFLFSCLHHFSTYSCFGLEEREAAQRWIAVWLLFQFCRELKSLSWEDTFGLLLISSSLNLCSLSFLSHWRFLFLSKMVIYLYLYLHSPLLRKSYSLLDNILLIFLSFPLKYFSFFSFFKILNGTKLWPSPRENSLETLRSLCFHISFKTIKELTSFLT